MTDKIREMTRRIDNTKDTALKLSELRKLKFEIIKLENDFIKKISQESKK
jgi:EAL domain-containing protein (putative c-di-GMP-specific phosphodiesterase class I)